LLAAARCNLFSYSLAAYQTNWVTINQKNEEVLEAHIKVIEKEPKKHSFGILKELAQENENSDKEADGTESVKLDVNDDDQKLFFGDEFSDSGPSGKKKDEQKCENVEATSNSQKLIDYEKEFDDLFMSSSSILLPSQLLMDDSLFDNVATNSNIDLLGSLSSQTDQNNADLMSSTNANKESSGQMSKNPSKKASDVSKWFNLFSELDPLNQQSEQDDASKNLHAA
jgi:hypothetical protein